MEGNIYQGLSHIVTQPSAEDISIGESSLSDQQSTENILSLNGSHNEILDEYSDGVQVSSDQNQSQITEPQTQAQTSDLQKICPTIQEKVDKFESEEVKRKADESPELSKSKGKKKAKSREKSQRQQESKL